MVVKNIKIIARVWGTILANINNKIHHPEIPKFIPNKDATHNITPNNDNPMNKYLIERLKTFLNLKSGI